MMNCAGTCKGLQVYKGVVGFEKLLGRRVLGRVNTNRSLYKFTSFRPKSPPTLQRIQDGTPTP